MKFWLNSLKIDVFFCYGDFLSCFFLLWGLFIIGDVLSSAKLHCLTWRIKSWWQSNKAEYWYLDIKLCRSGPQFTKLSSYRKFSWSLEAAIMHVIITVSIWNWTFTPTALLPRCLSNFKRELVKNEPESRSFETSRDLAVRPLTPWWVEAQGPSLWLLSWHPICNSFDDRTPVDFICGYPILKRPYIGISINHHTLIIWCRCFQKDLSGMYDCAKSVK